MITLEQFNKQYRYKADLKKYNTSRFDVWEIPKLEDGIYYGDCESYCRFLKANIPEFKDWDYYYCKLNGVGHCVLVKDENIIDCNIKQSIPLSYYYTVFNVTDLKKYGVFLVLFKILFSMAYVPYKEILNKIKRKVNYELVK